MQRALVVVLLVAAACGDSGHAGGVADAPTNDTSDAGDPDGSTARCTPPMMMCGGNCVSLASDPLNCGTCGHACGCGSTTCTTGLCDAHVLADQQSDPIVLAYSAGNLYWDSNISVSPPMTNVMVMPADGSVAARPLYTGRTAIRGFAFDAARIYFTRSSFNIVESGTLTGTSSGNFTNAQENGSVGIVSDGTNVFWANSSASGANPQALRRAANGAPVSAGTSIATGQVGADQVALDAANVYWTINDPTNGLIRSLPKTSMAGSTPTTLIAKQAHPHSLAVANGFVYWADQGDGVNKTGSINRIPVAGGTPTPLATGLSLPMTLAVDSDSVFWTDAIDGTISRVPIAGGAAPQVIVAHEVAPNGLVLTGSCLYFADEATRAVGTGSIRSHNLN